MQVLAALPQVAGLEAAAYPSTRGALSRRTTGFRGYDGIRLMRRKLSQQSISNRVLADFMVPTEPVRISRKKFGIRARVDVGIQDDVEQSRAAFLDFDNRVQGEVGRIALVTTLLLGVGTLAAVGSSEAATVVHLRDGLHSSLDTDMRTLAMGPEGPLLEEFWDNMRRYGFYFLTVASGGIYSLLKPLIDALRNPLTAILVIVVVTGTVYLVGLTVSAMLGINEFQYEYAP